MRNLAIASMCLAVSLAGPAAFGQQTAPRAHSAGGVLPAESPYLGVSGMDVGPELSKTLKMKEDHGAEVTMVDPESGAAKAGVKPGDVVLEFNGQKVDGWEQLKRLVHETAIRREVKITVWRNGAPVTLTATVGGRRDMDVSMGDGTVIFPPMPPMPAQPMPAMPPMDFPQLRTMMATPMLGIVGEVLGQEPQLAEFFGVKQGVLVRSVNPNSAAEKAGMKAGDVIVKIDDTHIANTQQINNALRMTHNKTVTVTVIRNKKEMQMTVAPEMGSLHGGLWSSGGILAAFLGENGLNFTVM